MSEPLNANPEHAIMLPRERIFWMAARQCLLILLGAIEDYLEIERSVIPKHKRVGA